MERAVRFLKDRFFAARTIHSIQQGNAQLLEFLTTTSLSRIHPCFADRTVQLVWQQEKPMLLRLPAPLPCTDLVTPVAIDKTAFARLDTNNYSVPFRFARRTLTLAADDTQVRLLDGSELVARHQRVLGFRQRVLHADKRRRRPVATTFPSGD